jgi:prepilin-type N-terminal cleavage/methylation domain-containing protein
MKAQRGFTLLELVVSIVIASILAGFMGMLIAGPAEAFFANSRRVRLADTADMVWQNIERDVRGALPNNVRTRTAGNLRALELLTVQSVVRYGSDLTFTGPDDTFSLSGGVIAGPLLARYIAVVGTGTARDAAYDGTVMSGPVDVTVNDPLVTLSQPVNFVVESQRRRLYVVSGAVSYVCDAANSTVTRYSGYVIGAVQPVAPGGTSALIANNVRNCEFNPPGVAGNPGPNADTGGVVTVRYTVNTAQGDAMTFVHAARIENPP